MITFIFAGKEKDRTGGVSPSPSAFEKQSNYQRFTQQFIYWTKVEIDLNLILKNSEQDD